MPVLPPRRHGLTPHPSHARRIGGWLPQDPRHIQKHVKKVVKKAEKAGYDVVAPISALQQLIDSNAAVRMLFTEMLVEVPDTPLYNQIPGEKPNSEIRDIQTLINTLNYQIQSPIEYNDSAQIGTPINAILDWPMATKAGFAAFLRDDVNKVFQDMLAYWGNYLSTNTDSAATITTVESDTAVGWLSAIAQSQEKGLANFLQTYIVPDPNDTIHYGFKTWDEFFIRQFQPGLRPVASPDDQNVIVSAAESTPFYIQEGVQASDTFWVKNKDVRTNYSLNDMLGDPEMAAKFVGGTVYQAFLSADSYHNWHAPVDGYYIKPTEIINGAYYSEPMMWSFTPDDGGTGTPDIGADELSQSYISAVAKRGVAYIQPMNPSIGLIAVVMIGMAEVSSVDFDQDPDYYNPAKGFKKGDQIGRFHFGGSTHCLVFQPNVALNFATDAIPSKDVTQPGNAVPVNSILATVAA